MMKMVVSFIVVVAMAMLVGACGKPKQNAPVAAAPAPAAAVTPAVLSDNFVGPLTKEQTKLKEEKEEKAREEKNKHALDGFFADPIGTILPPVKKEKK